MQAHPAFLRTAPAREHALPGRSRCTRLTGAAPSATVDRGESLSPTAGEKVERFGGLQETSDAESLIDHPPLSNAGGTARVPTIMTIDRRRGMRALRHGALLATLLTCGAAPLSAANTDPTLALMRATAVRGSSGRATLTLETSFSFDDAIQLALPIDVVVTQGTRVAHCALSGTVSLTVDGAAQSPGDAGVISVTDRRIIVVLPPQFAAGEASAQLVGAYSSKAVASNVLRFGL